MAQTYSGRAQQGYAPQADVYSRGTDQGRPVSDEHASFGQELGDFGIEHLQQYPAAVKLGAYGSADDTRLFDQQAAAQSVQPTQAQPAYVYDAAGRGFADDGTPLRPQLGKAQWGGAIVSLALIVGLGVWGYNLMVRDVSGVPVIRSMSEGARSVPENPGGQLAMHQGLSVNSVTADGSAGAPSDRLTLAPRPMELTDEDRPMGDTVTIVSSYQPNNAYTQTPEPAPVFVPFVEQSVASADEPTPLSLSAVESLSADTNLSDDTQAEIGTIKAGAFVTSPMPKARPVRLASAAAVLAAPSATDTLNEASLNGVAGDILAALGSEGEMQPTEVPVGARLVQFGAFQNEDIARAEWDRISTKFAGLMEGKTRVIEKAESGGKTFYRLRALGFTDAADSNRFCAALTARNAACVPARQR